jgi:hypothetical protein
MKINTRARTHSRWWTKREPQTTSARNKISRPRYNFSLAARMKVVCCKLLSLSGPLPRAQNVFAKDFDALMTSFTMNTDMHTSSRKYGTIRNENLRSRYARRFAPDRDCTTVDCVRNHTNTISSVPVYNRVHGRYIRHVHAGERY